jgi:hypothetical protein
MHPETVASLQKPTLEGLQRVRDTEAENNNSDPESPPHYQSSQTEVMRHPLER